MSLRTDIINLFINVKGDNARNELNELQKRASKVKSEMSLLGKETAEYAAKSKELSEIKTKMDSLRTTIGLTAFTLKELNAESRRLRALRDNLSPATEAFKKYDAELQAVIARQRELNGTQAGFQRATAGLKQAGQNVNSLLVGFFGFQAIVGSVSKVINGAIRLSDQFADLRRVAGFTKEEANNLNDSLLKLNTRTSGEGLLSIAITAGKLGVAKDQILSFTESVDKLVVTLGDELGDADQITTELGKILTVFDGKITGDNISKLGNSFIELANAGSSSGGFIADFTQRMSGLAKSAGLTLGSTVGLAAGFEELGLRVESGSSALQKIIIDIAKDIPKAAQIAGLPFKQFNDLFAKQPQEALLKYAEGLVKNKGAFAEVTAELKNAGAEGLRVQSTLQTIGEKTDFLRGKIELGNRAIQEQTALNKGFAEKNDTLAASVDRLGKQFDRMASSKGISNYLKTVTDGVNDLFSAITQFSNDGVLKTFMNFHEGLTTYLFKGEKAFKEFRERRKEMREATLEQKKEVFNFEFVPNSKPLPTSGLPSTGFKGDVTASPTQANNITVPEAVAETPEQKADREKSANERETSLKRAADFHKKELELIRQANRDEAEALKAKYKELADDEDKSYDDRFAALKLYYEAGNKLITQNRKDQQVALDEELKFANQNAKTPDEKTAIKNFGIQKQAQLDKQTALESTRFQIEVSNAFKKVATDNYKKLSAEGQKAYDDLKKAAGKFYKKQEDQIELNVDEKLIKLDKDFNEGKLKSAKDYEKKRQKIIEDGKIQELEFEISTLKIFINILKSQGIVSDELTKKIKDAQARLSGIKTGSIISKDDEKKSERLEKIQKIKEAADKAVEIATDAANVLENLEQRQLLKDKRLSDIKLSGYKKQLDSRLIGEKKYSRLVEEENLRLDKKKADLELKAFKRQQALSIANTVINGATAIAKIWAEVPKADFGAATIILTAISAATTLAQLAVITSQKPPQAAMGGVFHGPSHSQGGMTVYDNKTGKPTVEVEGGEPFMVLSKNTMKNNGPVVKALLDSSMNKNGAVVPLIPKWKTTKFPQINTDRVLPILASGGIVQSRPYPVQPTTTEKQDQVKIDIDRLGDRIENTLNKFKGRLTAEVSLKDLNRKEDLLNKAKRASGIN